MVYKFTSSWKSLRNVNTRIIFDHHGRKLYLGYAEGNEELNGLITRSVMCKPLEKTDLCIEVSMVIVSLLYPPTQRSLHSLGSYKESHTSLKLPAFGKPKSETLPFVKTHCWLLLFKMLDLTGLKLGCGNPYLTKM